MSTTGHILSTVGLTFGAASVAFAFQGPLRKWVRKCKRRQGGVYLVRVDHHIDRTRRVTGYVGETVNFYLRERQHLGTSRFDPLTGKANGTVTYRTKAQPWADLRPRFYKLIPLPWWLCWKWVLRPLETLVILATFPIYNDAKNKWNPRRIRRTDAQVHAIQRATGNTPNPRLRRIVRRALQLAGVLLILTGIIGALTTR